ncbi:hypothetical protein RSA11_04285 [Exiguobacterium indicum]|uniref:Uncharacterized protein n=1 Tax=Exiguobacterium indicum TaxID=296995 RepID=A0AAW3MDM1_9BACL|nr:hypothetical protein [Exiguobacterium indicum]KTR27889.1 hypothetical protein RSA11_04285 [Exiguobacterium indicum]
MKVGRKIYYDKTSGNVLVDTGEKSGDVVETTTDQDVANFKALFERNRDSFEFLKLEYGQYAQDFAECNGYRVDPQTREIEFSYPDPSQPQQPPIYQKALSEQIEELRADNLALSTTVDSILTDILPTILG